MDIKMKKKILAFILSGCIFIQNSGLIVQATELPLYTQVEAETENGDVGEGGSAKTLEGIETSSETPDSEDSRTSSGERAEGEKGSSGAADGKEETKTPTEADTKDEAGNSDPAFETPSGENGATTSGENGETPSGENGETTSGENGEAPSGENGDTTSGENSETPSGENGGITSGENDETASEESGEAASETDIDEEAEAEEALEQNMTDVSENTVSEGIGEAAAIEFGQVEEGISGLQYAYVQVQQETDVEALNSQSIDNAKGLYFGYVENDAKKHTGTLKEYISDSGTVTVPHKLGKSYMVEIGDGAFADMNKVDSADTSKLPQQSTTDKTLLSSGETKILELLNAARIKQGKRPLVMSSTLRAAARCKTLDMFNRNYFDHPNPDRVYSYNWLYDCGYPPKDWNWSWAENIAYNSESAEKLHNQWLNSKGHYANMMDENSRSVGIGVYKGSDGKIMGAQIFSSVIFQNLTGVTIEFGYEKIGNRAFSGCSNLKTVTIPSTVTEIAANAFDGCTKLTIRGKEGSYAQTYAQAHGITFKAISEKSPIEKFGFDENEIFLEVGDWDYAGVKIIPEDYAHLVKITKEGSAIDYQVEDGTVHAISKGTVTIKARAADMEDSCKITVGVAEPIPIKNLSFYDKELVLYIGENIKPAYRIEPVNTTETVQLSSSDKSIFTVNEDDASTITALKAGNAVLTVSAISEGGSIGLSASVNVKVLTVDEKLALPKDIKAVTNITPTLAGVSLPEGFSWKIPETKLKASAKAPVQYFAAQYENDIKNIRQDCVLPVAVSSVSGMLVEMDGKSLSGSTKLSLLEQQYKLAPSVKSTGAGVEASFLEVNFKTDNSDIIDIEKQMEGGNPALFLTPKKSGKCSVTIEVRLKDGKGSYGPSNKPYGVYKKKYTFQVEDAQHVNAFQIKLEPETQEGVQLLADGTIQAEENATKFQIRVTGLYEKAGENGTESKEAKNVALKFKADKSKVLKVKTVKGNNGLIEVNVKKTGEAVISVTAQDKGRRSRNIAVCVKKSSPQLNGKTWILNKLKPEAAALMDMQAAEGNPIQEIILCEDKEAKKVANLFEVKLDSAANTYVIGFKNGNAVNVTKNSYKLFLKAVTGAGEYVYPITVKLKNSKPSVKLKQSEKINIFYKDAEARLEINTGAEKIKGITQINVANGRPHFEAEFETSVDGVWSARIYPVNVTASNYKSAVKNIELKFSFQDYEGAFSITKKLSVKSCYQKAVLTTVSSEPLIYSKTGAEQVVFRIKEKTSGKILAWGGDDNIDIRLEKGTSKGIALVQPNDEDKAKGGEQDIRVNLPKAKKNSLTVKLMVSHDNWREAAYCTVKLAVNTQTPTFALDKTKLSFNTNAVGKEVVDIKASVSKNEEVAIVRLREADIVGTTSAARRLLSENKLTICPQKDGNGRNLKICLNSSDVGKGTYKYKVYAWCMLEEKAGEKKIACMNPVTLSITVTNKQPSVTLKAKGKIDIANPVNTGIVYTPKVSSAMGDIRTVSLKGGYSSQFILTDLGNGAYRVRLREGSPLVKGKYKIYFKLVLDNGIEIESKAVTVKL